MYIKIISLKKKKKKPRNSMIKNCLLTNYNINYVKYFRNTKYKKQRIHTDLSIV